MAIGAVSWIGSVTGEAVVAAHCSEISINLVSFRDIVACEPGACAVFVEDENNAVATAVASIVDAGTWHPVVAVSSSPAVERVIYALRAGACDYFPVSTRSDDFRTVIERIALEAEAIAVERARAARAAMDIRRLSPREKEVLSALVEAGTNKEIARRIGISHRTIEIHRANLMRKLTVENTPQAIATALRADQVSGWR